MSAHKNAKKTRFSSLTVLCIGLAFAPTYASFDLDIDDDGKTEALTDGLLVIRHLFGFSGDSLTANATGTDAQRSDAASIESHLVTNKSSLDVDGDGSVEALTDGLLIIRELFGFSGDSLITGAVSSSVTHTTAVSVTDYLKTIKDTDNDGYLDSVDAFLTDATEWVDSDSDGTGNNVDTDDDGDGVADSADAFPLDATEWVDSDSDGIGDNSDTEDALGCQSYIDNAPKGEFRYCWEESQTASGTEYSANILSPITVIFSDESLEIPDISYAELLYSEYGLILVKDSLTDLSWSNDQAYALHQVLKKIPQNVRNEANDNRDFSKWTLTESELTDDIEIVSNSDGTKTVQISSSAFDNANPRIASVEGKRGTYFSNRLHLAAVRFVTNNGLDKTRVNRILKDRYGISIEIDDYLALTGEPSSRFQDFQDSELVSIINMFEEMPSGFHKIEGMDYLVRRVNGAESPVYPEAPAIAWVDSGYVEFMEKGFKQFSIDYVHRLILHEKAHFLWGKVFDQTLKDDWTELGGWYECEGDTDGWCTTLQTEFVSAYAHLKNPNEDMAESISFFIVNPDALKSRSLKKYEFIRDRVMQGDIYISIIQENLTFTVYNLYPDYVFPGKIKQIKVSVMGEPNEDKTVAVELELHALNELLEGASQGFTRLHSTADTYVDFYLYPTDGIAGTKLKGTRTLSKYAKAGYWKPSQMTLSDAAGNLRMAGINDFGWRMYVNNPLEDLDPPVYVANSVTLSLSSQFVQDQQVDKISATWSIDEKYPKENQGCYGVLNDENASTYSLEKYSPQTYGGNYVAGTCYVEWLMPYYMPSGTYRMNYIRIIDEAGNEARNYFQTPSGIDTGTNFAGVQLDEFAPEITLQTLEPDVSAPELDLNDLGITATPTYPNNPNGETKVDFRFRVKDDISGYQVGYYTFRDPQGLTQSHYHYPSRRSDLIPLTEDLEWSEYTASVVLPAGSAPGTWGVVEITLRDRAQNFKTYNFTEIVSFQILD